MQNRISIMFGSFLLVLAIGIAPLAASAIADTLLADGILVLDTSDNHGTIYIIDSGIKRGFVSPEVFTGLGYKFSQTVKANLSDYPAGQPVISEDLPHPPGALIKIGPAIFKVVNNGKQLIPDIKVFNSWNWQTNSVVPANGADLALPDLDPLNYKDTAAVSNGNVAGSVINRKVLPDSAILTDGTLVQAISDPKVYYILNGMKRWILSPEAFRVQGFRWTNVVSVSSTVLDRYQEAEQITELTTRLLFPGEENALPDLVPFPMQDVYLATRSGRTILGFTSNFWNQGNGRLDLITDPTLAKVKGDIYLESFQHIIDPSGNIRDKVVGNFLWHQAHLHFHFSDFADYVLEPVKPVTDQAPLIIPPEVRQKTTFCMRDDLAVNLSLNGASRKKFFTTCNKGRQGVSVGWADVYLYSLPDQFIDITDMPSGVYRLSFNVDPRQHFIEGRYDNNSSVVLVQLDVQNSYMKVLASASAYAGPQNQYPDGMLIRGMADKIVYVIQNNKKLPVDPKTTVGSLAFPLDAVYDLPQSIVDVIPSASLVLVPGNDEVYVLNNLGSRRGIVSLEVFNSYGWHASDIVTINQAELAYFPATDLIMRPQDGSVYSISGKRNVGIFNSLPTLGLNPDSIHNINETDFRAYGF
ncbi:MAG: lysyl oxidase family protein [Candidatus Doudnabacteria bacterium]